MGVTIHDVAARAGVSIKTVSRVMNAEPNVRDAVRERVREAMHALDYIPNAGARRMANARSFLIGLFFHPQLSSYITGIQLGAARRCRDRDYLLAAEPLEIGNPDIPAIIERTVRRAHLDGVILVPPQSNDVPLIELLERLEVPFVRISPGIEPERGASVFVDERRGGFEATRHLIALGHRDIGFVGGMATATRAARFRRDGFFSAMAEAGLPVCEQWVVEGEFTFASGQRCAEALLSNRRRPTAIVAASDAMAAGVLSAAIKRGLKLPHDLSVTGFDDVQAASIVTPSLTTIRQPLEQLGEVAADFLLGAQLTGKLEPVSRQLDIELIVRDSTAPPAAA